MTADARSPRPDVSADLHDVAVAPGAWAARLLDLGLAVRGALVAARGSGDDLTRAVAEEGGDTIFAIDRYVEPVIEQVIASWPASCKPLLLIAEGMGADGRSVHRAHAKDASPLRYRLIVDPIDGTRNIMYDKRAAWFIAAVAPDLGEATTLADAVAAAIVELPASKAGYADAFTATAAGEATGSRMCLRTGARTALQMKPSTADSLRYGFAQVSNFFPGTKVLASELMERIAIATLGEVEPGSATIFEDQYISTAGQMVELMVGHDRFCCDLRPLFYEVIERERGRAVQGHLCHPYDMAGLLVAQRAGVVVTDGFGQPLRSPLDVHSGVHWCGYANETLRRQIEPVVVAWLRERGVAAPS